MEGSKTNPGKANNTSSVHVIVDADACPRGAMEVLRRLRREYGYKLVTVASFHHDIGGDGPAGGGEPDGTDGAAGADDAPGATDAPGAAGAGIEHVTVGDAPDEADLAVVNRTRPGDIVVTQDWGLAALVLGKGARCLSPAGYEYTPQRIDFQLHERHVKAKHRRAGGRTRGPRARTDADDQRFERTLRRLLENRP